MFEKWQEKKRARAEVHVEPLGGVVIFPISA
jgi:hypothetical protein